MEMTERYVVAVTDPSQVGEARRLGCDLARSIGFDDVGVGRVGIAVTEAATNIVKHAPGGHILLRAGAEGVGLIALDRGPGMRDVGRAMRDGFSTAGTPGNGLGAIARQASEFDIYTVPGHGTALIAEFRCRERAALGGGVETGGVSVPKPGQTICGDGWGVIQAGPRALVLVADGLGHGPLAAAASTRALDVFRTHATDSALAIVQRMHEALRPTRGAAVGLAEVDRNGGIVRFVGVGNIAGAIVTDGRVRSVVSHHGTMGHDVRKIQEFQYPWSRDALLVLSSDGLTTRWDLAAYPGLAQRHPALVAAVLYRDFARGNDDATAVVLREAA